MSERYANASIIIPQVICIMKAVDNTETKKVLRGLGGTVTKVVEEMDNRYGVYLHNPNLMLATYFDPRYKHCPFKKEPYNPDAVEKLEKLIVERYLEHEKQRNSMKKRTMVRKLQTPPTLKKLLKMLLW